MELAEKLSHVQELVEVTNPSQGILMDCVVGSHSYKPFMKEGSCDKSRHGCRHGGQEITANLNPAWAI